MGVVTLFIGLYFLRSSKQAVNLKQEMNEQDVLGLLDNYGKALKLFGLSSIVFISLSVIVLIIALVITFSAEEPSVEFWYQFFNFFYN